ncbi:cysteine hydrolase family protein [Hydrogenophaga sp. XSHU_21]
MPQVLVLIDLQNDYFPGGRMELVRADEAVARASVLLQAFRTRSLPVIHIQHLAEEADATFFLPGTPGADLHRLVQPAAGDALVIKHFPNGFRETRLLDHLRAAGATGITFAGMMTHMCVDTTVRAASDLGFACELAQDACATTHLRFGDRTVEADDVQAAYLSALNDGFAAVRPVDAIVGSLG